MLIASVKSRCGIGKSELKGEIEKIKESLQSETKSTAGDKHETGRAMLQLEREQLGLQLLEVEKTLAVLKRIRPEEKNHRAVLGSLVKTDMATYFLSISAGRVLVDRVTVLCISPAAPVGQLLLGKGKGDTFVFRGKKTTIMDIQ